MTSTTVAFRASTSWSLSINRLHASGPTISIFICVTVTIRKRRWKKPCVLWKARRIAGTTFNRPQVEQPQYNLLNRRIEKDLAAYVVEHGVGLTVYGPLASGLLTGKYDDGIPEGSRLARLVPQREHWYRAELVERVRRFRKIADDLGAPRAAVAIAWLLTRPGVSTVITGATNPDQLRSNLQALTLQLPPAVLAEIDDILPGPQTGPQGGLQQRWA